MGDEKKSWSADDFGKRIHDEIHEQVRDRIRRNIADRMSGRARRDWGLEFFWGAFIALAGIALLLDRMGILPWSESFKFWPALLIVLGAVILARRSGRSTWGALLAIVGAVMLGNRLGYVHVRFADLWPLILIAVGLMVMWHSFEGRPWWARRISAAPAGSADPSNRVHVETVFGSTERRITAQNFQGGNLAAIFGEVKLDLRSADIEGDKAVLIADAVFGSVQVRVPDAWIVVSRGNGVFGRFGDSTHSTDVEDSTVSNRKKLVVTGGAVFGEVEIKN